jgi:hypothetical protein
MKKRLFSIMAIGAIALTSCKKEEVLDSNQLGEATINGNVFAYLDERNDVNADGIYISNLTPENVAGISVSVSVNTRDWDQTPDYSYDYPVKTYTTVTDADGNYTLTIPATDEQLSQTINFGNILATYYEYTTDGSEVTKEVEVIGGSQGVTLFNGAVATPRKQATWNNVSGSTTEFGSATIRGMVYANWDAGINAESTNQSSYTYNVNNVTESVSGSPIAGQTLNIYYTYIQGNILSTGADNVMTMTIAADGSYEMSIPTPQVNAGYANMAITSAEFVSTQVIENQAGDADSSRAVIYRANSGSTINVSGFYDGDYKTQDIFFTHTAL